MILRTPPLKDEVNVHVKRMISTASHVDGVTAILARYIK